MRNGHITRSAENGVESSDSDEASEKMIADLREIYAKYNGRKLERIEAEMRELGWAFSREMLYKRKRSGGYIPGLIEQFKLKRLTAEVTYRAKPAKPAKPLKTEFESWLKQTFPEWTWTWKYQRYLYERLSRVTSGETKRLMIFMPPRHGKSETVTVRYTAWRLLRDPKLNVILGSYNQRLADRFSRKIKRIVIAEKQRRGVKFNQDIQDEHDIGTANNNNPVYPVHPVKYSSQRLGVSSVKDLLRSASEWETESGGVVRSVGVGIGIAGFGAGLIVIDDPVRNRADAESQTFRDKVWDWFNDDIYTRLEPNAAIILIQTRWHEDDLAGRLLKEAVDGGEKWEVVKLPAIMPERGHPCPPERETRNALSAACGLMRAGSPRSDTVDWRKPGQALCPKRFSVAALERIKKKLGSYSFSALYQQDPVPAEGGSFKREWFRNIIDSPPNGMRWKRGYDLAISTRTSADYTASFRCAFDKQGNIYIADGFRKRIEYPEQRRFIIDRMQNEPGTEHGIESAMHGKAVVQELRHEPTVRQHAFREVRVNEDKLTRALAWLNLAEAGKVFLVRGPWIAEFIDEVCRFPAGRFDDQVDAISIAVSMLSRTGKGSYGF